MNFEEGKVVVRDYVDSDYEDVVNLNIKHNDSLELERMSNLTFKEYIVWHLSELKDKTKVCLYDNKIVGIIGIEDTENTLWFTTEELGTAGKVSLVRLFNKVLNTLMLESNKKHVIAYLDAEYSSAIRWVLSKGFKRQKDVMINNNKFHIIKYVLS